MQEEAESEGWLSPDAGSLLRTPLFFLSFPAPIPSKHLPQWG